MKVSIAAITIYATFTDTAAFSFESPGRASWRGTTFALFAEEGKAVSDAVKASSGTGLTASKAVPFVAPVAALAAGRQALTKRDVLREQEAITTSDLNRIQSDLKNADTLIATSFGLAAVTSAIALTNLVGVQFNPPGTTSATEASSASTTTTRAPKVEKAPKKVEASTPKTFARKAPLALRSPAKSKPSPVEKDTGDSNQYDGLMSKLGRTETKPAETSLDTVKTPAVTTRNVETERSEPPSFIDTVMQKVEEKKAEAAKTTVQPVEEKPAAPEAKETAKSEAKVAEEANKMEKKIEKPQLPPATPIPEKAEPPKQAESTKSVDTMKTETPKVEEKKLDTKAVTPLVESKESASSVKPEALKVEEKKPDMKAVAPLVTPKESVETIKPKVPTVEEKKPDTKAVAPLVTPKESVETIKPKVPTVAEKKVDTKAVAPLTTSSASMIDSGTSAVAVGAGVGIAALGIFAALVAAQDQDSSTTTKQDIAPKTAPTTADSGAEKTAEKPSPLLDTIQTTPDKPAEVSSGRQEYMQMGPLVEERKTPPKQEQSGPPLGALSYIDALSTPPSTAPASVSNPGPPKAPWSEKKATAAPGMSYLESLSASSNTSGKSASNEEVNGSG